MNILIISRTPWDNNDSFGNTFSNLFGKMENVNIFNICCQSGVLNSSVPTAALQITEKNLLKNKFNKSIAVANKMKKVEVSTKQEKRSKAFNFVRANMRTFGYVVRDFIWQIGNWKKSKELEEFLQQANPDVIYLPIYNSIHMGKVQRYIIERLNVPVVGHISDDVFYAPKSISPIKAYRKKKTHKGLKWLIDRCSYLEVFAENMQEEYSKLFNKECFLIGKGIDLATLSNLEYKNIKRKEKVQFLYTGGIGNGRDKLLCEIADAIERGNYSAVIDVYTGTALNNRQKKAIAKRKALRINGFVSSDELKEIRSNADVLIHVEGADQKSIMETRMSFSTKIIDYLQTDKPIFAYGSDEVNSIAVLKNHGIAIVADKENIDEQLQRFFTGQISLQTINEQVMEYLHKYRDIQKIQSGIYNRMYALCAQSCSKGK